MTYQAAKARLDALDAKLSKLTKSLHDKNKFQPVTKKQWEIVFDQVEIEVLRAVRANPEQFCIDFPRRKVLAVYLGLVAA